MTRTVTAAYERPLEAEQALARAAREVTLIDCAVIGDDETGRSALDRLGLSSAARAACEEQLARGASVLVARVEDEESADRMIDVLNRIEEGRAGSDEIEEQAPPAAAESAAAVPAPEPAAAVGEEIRIGSGETVRGRARVEGLAPSQAQEAPRGGGESRLDTRPSGRRLTEEEVASGGLLKERVIEIAETREEPVIRKEAFVREEVVVRKSVEERTEQVEDTVRRTEVDVERLEPARSAFGDFGGKDRDEPLVEQGKEDREA
jgi:hypothetical protein